MLPEKVKKGIVELMQKVIKLSDTDAAPKEYTLKDGNKLLIDKLEAGGTAQSVDAKGNTALAAEGNYELADGTTLTVGSEGKIGEVVAGDANIESKGGKEEQMRSLLHKMTAHEQDATSLKAEVAQLKETVNTLSGHLTTALDLVKEIADLPGAEPLEQQFKAAQATDKKDTMRQRIQAAKH
jgi:hypothetical protein